MIKRGNLNVPVIGVAKAGWNLDNLKARARDSLEKHGGLDAAAFDKLCGLLRYVDGDYEELATFTALRRPWDRLSDRRITWRFHRHSLLSSSPSSVNRAAQKARSRGY